MRIIRIYVAAALQAGADLCLPAQASEHVGRVLRLAAGDPLVLFNGDGSDYAALVRSVGKREVVVTVGAATLLTNESPLALTLAQGLARGDKMDLIIQKATELGVRRVVPLLTERSEVKLDAGRAEKRLAHWLAVALSACEQSGRACVPQIDPIQPLGDWLGGLGDVGLRLTLLPQASQRVVDLNVGSHGGVLAVGPEGGLGERDVALLLQHRFTALNLGPRILRTETAGLAALAAIQAVHGDG